MLCWSCSGAIADGAWRILSVSLDGEKNIASTVAFICDPCAGDKTEKLTP